MVELYQMRVTDNRGYDGTTTLYQTFFSREPTSSMCRCFVSINSCSPSMPNSLPMPLCLYPPNGAHSDSKCHSFTQTVPARNRCAMERALSLSFDQTPPPSPYIESLARATASSAV